MAAPPLPDGAPPLPQEPPSAAPWAPPPDLIGSSNYYGGGAPAAHTNGVASLWAPATGRQAGYSNSAGYTQSLGQGHNYAHPQHHQQQYDPYGQLYQQQYWDPSQAANHDYTAYGAQPGYGAQVTYSQQQQPYAAPGPQVTAMSNPYAQMYGQTWSQASRAGAYALHQQPQAGPPSGYGNPHGAPSQQSNPYGSLYGAAQLQQQPPGQQQSVPWAAPLSSAPAQQPDSLPPLPEEPPLPGEPPMPGSASLPNGHVAQDAEPYLDDSLHMPLADVLELIHAPGRAKRPKRIAIIMRGIPGSGKSFIARKLRDAEMAAGGEAPRVHSIDDYFITEMEKEVWEKDVSGKRKLRLVQETGYKYEEDMEGPYKASLLKAFQRTVEEARFTFVIVDANNLRFEDFKAFWSVGQRAGYEVYGMQAPELDPKVCHGRNIHGRSLEEITSAAQAMESIPSLYPQLDASGLLREAQPKRKQTGIKEVDMEDSQEESAGSEAEVAAAIRAKSRWADLDEADEPVARRSKKARMSATTERQNPAPPAFKKRVRWADDVEDEDEDIGFSIGGASRQQLETVYVLEGLGPPKDQAAASRTFADQVKMEHQSEGKSFRDVLFGGHKR